LAQEQVVRLEIAVDELAGVRAFQTNSGLAEQAHHAPRQDGAFALERGAQLLAVQVFHDQPERAVVGGLEVEHLHDVIVGQELADLELALEALDRDLITGHVGVKNLERHVAAHLHVERLVHTAHAAVGHHAAHLIAIAHELADARVLVVGQDRDLCGAAQLGAVNRTKARVVGVKPAAQRACLHASLDSLEPAGMTAR
jgi:hypothetical protein